jgi:hypothetical protein
MLADARTGRNGRHWLAGLLRQSVFGRLVCYEDVNDADRLRRDPVMRWVVGDRAISGSAASASQMGRFETKWLSRPENLAALADLPGQWIEKVHQWRPPKIIVLNMGSSESSTYGEQEGSAYNGHFGCTCCHPLFVFNQLGDLERSALLPGNVHSADGWREVLEPVVSLYRGRVKRLYFRGDAAFANPESTSCSKPKAWVMRSGCRPTGCCRRRSATCSSVRWVDRRRTCVVSIPASATGPDHGISRAEWWPKLSCTRASFIRGSASSSPTWCGRPSASSPSTTTAARQSSGSKRARAIKWTRLSCRTFAANSVCLQLHALAYNLGKFMRTLATPNEPWSLTSLREKLIKIGAKVVSHGRYVTFQMAEVGAPRRREEEIW